MLFKFLVYWYYFDILIYDSLMIIIALKIPPSMT